MHGDIDISPEWYLVADWKGISTKPAESKIMSVVHERTESEPTIGQYSASLQEPN